MDSTGLSPLSDLLSGVEFPSTSITPTRVYGSSVIHLHLLDVSLTLLQDLDTEPKYETLLSQQSTGAQERFKSSLSTGGGTRTHTGLQTPPDFESGVSTNSTTPARVPRLLPLP